MAVAMEPSILKSIKKMLGIDPALEAFDQDIMVLINSALDSLHQLGIGPISGYAITDDSNVWPEFSPNTNTLGSVVSYVYIRTKLIFDPPLTSFVIEAYERQLHELAWRIQSQKECEDIAATNLLASEEGGTVG